jgi:3-hydroxy-9,10-secoandrosta-1,3,5(10)-triene-9,17-dione monooxygenase reductase component
VTAIDPGTLRKVAGRFATGVTVVTAVHNGKPCGITVNSFTSVSLEPPLVLIAVAKKARAYACLEATGRFAVNVLSDAQEGIARLFASLAEDKFAGLRYRSSPGGQPLLAGIHAWLDCEITERHPGGRTHTVFTARVTAIGAGRGRPLLFHRRAYRRIGAYRSRQ